MKLIICVFLMGVVCIFNLAALPMPSDVLETPLSNKTHLRRSEGSFVKLKDSSILHIYTRFNSSSEDHSAANLVKIHISSDGKKILSEEQVVVSPTKGNNVMSPSLLRLQDGRILLVYLEKQKFSSIICCRVVIRYSANEGKSWTSPEIITKAPVYCVVVNDSVLQLKNGRICIPVSQYRYTNNSGLDSCGVAYCLYSDDAGKTWKESQSILFPQDKKISAAGFQEPVIIEASENNIFMYIRSDLGFLYKAVSKDKGNTWSTPQADKNFPSSIAPAKIFQTSNKHLVMIFNMNPSPHNPKKNCWDRSFLAIKISKDNGKTWSQTSFLEKNPSQNFSYPSVIEINNGNFLCSYYLLEKKNFSVWHLKIKRFHIK